MWKEQSQNFYKRDSYPCDSSTKISSARHTKSTKAKDRCIVTKSFRLTKAAQRRREATPENPREATPPPGARSARERPRPCNRRAPGWRSPRSPRQRAESEHAAGPAEGRQPAGAGRRGMAWDGARPLTRPERRDARSSSAHREPAVPCDTCPGGRCAASAVLVTEPPAWKAQAGASAASWEGVSSGAC